jgi:hypothetical protein
MRRRAGGDGSQRARDEDTWRRRGRETVAAELRREILTATSR